MARSHGTSQPSVRPKARQKAGSSKVSCTGMRNEDCVSVRVHAQYELFAPLKAISPPSDPCIWYPPAIAVCTASWIVIGYSLWSISLPFLRQPHAMMARTAYHCERDERPVSLHLVPRESPSRYTAACLSASTQRSRMV